MLLHNDSYPIVLLNLGYFYLTNSETLQEGYFVEAGAVNGVLDSNSMVST